ncbi:MAG: peptide MFS transporter [Burkholderiales bacterium]|nr:peptide MFS transporter [Burkholderiales bacterium]
MPNPTSTAEPTWLGHPRGLVVLFVAEMWERMSYYGMRSLLVLYMIQHLFVRADHAAGVWGYDALSQALQTAFGPLSTQALSSQVYGLYTGFVYLSPLFGGLLADRLIGRRKAVVLGGVLMAIGHFLMASEHLFFVALLVLILGNGCFKPNVSTQVGGLYAPGDPRRDRAFSIFYVGINLGAFIAPLICGTLGQTLGWDYGFGAAGVGMLLGLLFYVLNQHRLPVEPPPTASRTAPGLGVLAYLAGMPLVVLALLALLTLPQALSLGLALAVVGAGLAWMLRLPADERPRVVALAVACLISAAFWAVYEQQGNTMQLWADQSTVWPSVFGFTLPSTWYQAFNPFMIALFVPLLNAVWARQARRGREPSSLTKMALGCVLLGLGFVVMIVAATGLAPGDKRSILWLLASTAVFTLGELYLSPIGLSFVTKVAPARIVSMMMGLWFLANFIGGYMSGYLGSFYGTMSHPAFFAMLTAIGVAAGAVLYAMGRPLQRIVQGHDRPAAALAA